MRCHEVDYEILGNSMQIVEVELDPGETVIAETGAMTYLEDGITFETKMGDGFEADEGVMSKLFGAGKRMIMGESIFTTHCPQILAASRGGSLFCPYPGDIIAIDMAQIGEQMICQKDTFCYARQ